MALQYQEVILAESPTVYQWGDNDSSIAQVVDVTADNGAYPRPSDIAKDALGWATYSITHKIQRHLPLYHTDAPWLWCTKVSGMRGRGLFKKTIPTDFPEGTVERTEIGYARYKKYRCVLFYNSLPYLVLPDSKVNQEWQRFCEWIYEPGIEVIARPLTNSWKFIGQGAGPVSGTVFPREIMSRAPKSHLRVIWHQVPAPAVVGPNNVVSTNITKGIGKVNQQNWPGTVATSDPVALVQGDQRGVPLGYTLAEIALQALGQAGTAPPPTGFRAGTLLFTQVSLRPIEAPVSPGAMGMSSFDRARNVVPREFDVLFDFIHFDPPTDPTSAPLGNTLDYGHNLVPSIRNDGSAGYYYAVTSDGTATGEPIYKNYNYDLLFLPL